MSSDELQLEQGLLRDLIEGRRLGVVVRGFLSPTRAAELVEVVSRASADAGYTPVPHASGAVYGGLLAMAQSTGVEAYLAHSAESHALRVGDWSVEHWLRSQLARLCGGEPLQTPMSADGRSYAPFSVRRMDPGGTLLLHCENETASLPILAEVAAQIDSPWQLSFYVLLQPPTAGAELVIYPYCHGAPSGEVVANAPREVDQVLQQHGDAGAIVPKMQAGDLILFDAGRYFHLLTPCVGPRPRWTLGALLARNKSKSGWMMWS